MRLTFPKKVRLSLKVRLSATVESPSECIKVSDARKQNRSLAPSSFTAFQFGLTYHEEESHELDEIPVEDLDKYYLLYGSKERPLVANLAVQETRSPPPPPQPQIR